MRGVRFNENLITEDMKKSILLLLLLLPFILNCQKQDSEKAQRIQLNITSSTWYTTITNFNNNGFCNVYLKVSGSTNGELLSIDTFGDGLNGCLEITCDKEGKFNTDVPICFFLLRDSIQKKFYTTLTSYSSKIKPNIFFCDAVGSGDTLKIKLESPLMMCKLKK
jgi:hypothetical protein